MFRGVLSLIRTRLTNTEPLVFTETNMCAAYIPTTNVSTRKPHVVSPKEVKDSPYYISEDLLAFKHFVWRECLRQTQENSRDTWQPVETAPN
jgi:hypothetical protein